jgi:hypothetical protein
MSKLRVYNNVRAYRQPERLTTSTTCTNSSPVSGLSEKASSRKEACRASTHMAGCCAKEGEEGPRKSTRPEGPRFSGLPGSTRRGNHSTRT